MVRELTEVTCALIRQDGRTLAVQRSEHMPHPLKWEFPGGKIMTGESPEKCIKREIREELGVEIRVEALLPTVVHTYGDRMIRLIPFVCSLVSGEIHLTEHTAWTWMSDPELEQADLLEADRRLLSKLQRGGSAA